VVVKLVTQMRAIKASLLQSLPDRDRRLSIIFDIDVTVADFVGEAHLIERNLK